MSDSPRVGCEDFIARLYEDAHRCPVGLNLETRAYRSRLDSIIRKYLGEIYSYTQAMRFLSNTHTNDLYLATACTEGIEVAWERFAQLFNDFIYRVAASACSNATKAEEIAANVITDLYVPDRLNRRRIASYDGQGSIAAWLRVVISHRVADERDLKWNAVERLDDHPDVVDLPGVEKMEARLEACR